MKTLYVWEDINSGLTHHYHSGGGAAVIASSLEEAMELLKSFEVSESSEVFTQEPNYTTPVVSDKNQVFIFPDAGCC